MKPENLKTQKLNNQKGSRGSGCRIRTRMLKKVKMNFKNDHRKNLKCENCEMEEDETQEHVMMCPAWTGERGSLDMTQMKDQVEFIMKVMKRKVR